MRTSTPLPTALRGTAFTRADARAQDVPNSRLNATDLRSPFSGTRVPAAGASRHLELEVLLRQLPAHTVFCGATAAWIYGLALPLHVSATLDSVAYVAVPRGARAIRRAGVVGRALDLTENDVASFGPWRVTSPARTLVDLAQTLDLRSLVAVADQLISIATPFCSQAQLRGVARRFKAGRGARKLAECLQLANGLAESPAESMLRVILWEAGLPTPLVNEPLFDARGTFVARVDLLFAEFGIIVEYEGDHHRIDKEQWRRDITRIGKLQALGFHVERAQGDDLTHPDALIARLRHHLRLRGWRP